MTRATRTLRRGLTAAAAAAALVGGLTTAAAAPAAAVQVPPELEPRPSTGVSYVALGDSVAYGFDPVALATGADAQSLQGYPEAIGGFFGLDVINLACPGETSSGLVDVTVLNGCDAFAAIFGGLKTDYQGSQTEAAVEILSSRDDVGLVTVQIGANDLFACQATSDGCSPEEFAEVLQTVSANLTRTLGEIRAVYDGQLVLVDYYALDYASRADRLQGQAFRSVLQPLAAAFDAELANAYRLFRGVASTADGSTCDAGLLIPLAPGTCDIHTSPEGDRLLAAAVVVELDRRGRQLFTPGVG